MKHKIAEIASDLVVYGAVIVIGFYLMLHHWFWVGLPLTIACLAALAFAIYDTWRHHD